MVYFLLRFCFKETLIAHLISSCDYIFYVHGFLFLVLLFHFGRLNARESSFKQDFKINLGEEFHREDKLYNLFPQ